MIPYLNLCVSKQLKCCFPHWQNTCFVYLAFKWRWFNHSKLWKNRDETSPFSQDIAPALDGKSYKGQSGAIGNGGMEVGFSYGGRNPVNYVRLVVYPKWSQAEFLNHEQYCWIFCFRIILISWNTKVSKYFWVRTQTKCLRSVSSMVKLTCVDAHSFALKPNCLDFDPFTIPSPNSSEFSGNRSL